MAKTSTEHKKALRDLLDRSLDAIVPLTDPQDFSIQFRVTVTHQDIARGITYAELMVRQLVQKACEGNDKSIGEILDRLIGKPVQTAEVTTRHYTYNDFLLSIVEQEQKEKHKVIDVPSQPTPALPVEEQPETDLLADLL